MRRVLVIRFSSLGDLCLLAWSLTRWSRGEGGEGREVTLVTKEAFAPLMRAVPGIKEVVALPAGAGLGSLLDLGRQLRRQDFHKVIDAHAVLRSQGLLMAMGRRPATRLRKDTFTRLRLLGVGGHRVQLNRTMTERFDNLFSPLDPLGDPRAPLAHLAGGPGGDDAPLGLAPGAQWDTKRWPEENFAEVLEGWLEGKDGPVRLFLGPREDDWYRGSRLAAVAGSSSRVEIVREADLVKVAGLLGECRRVLTNDSGLLHMAEAAGTPVTAFFGPTVRQFGYFPRLERSDVLERDLECRPCSRNGKKPCKRGDLACLRDIPVAQALAALMDGDDAGEATP